MRRTTGKNGKARVTWVRDPQRAPVLWARQLNVPAATAGITPCPPASPSIPHGEELLLSQACVVCGSTSHNTPVHNPPGRSTVKHIFSCIFCACVCVCVCVRVQRAMSTSFRNDHSKSASGVKPFCKQYRRMVTQKYHKSMAIKGLMYFLCIHYETTLYFILCF